MQHAPFLKYMFERGLFRGLGDYDYNIGLGADYTVSFAYYMMFDPINLLQRRKQQPHGVISGGAEKRGAKSFRILAGIPIYPLQEGLIIGQSIREDALMRDDISNLVVDS